MAVRKNEHIGGFRLRAKLPRFFRYAAVVLLAGIVLVVVAGFYRARSKTPFKLKGEHAQLSTDVTAEINGYERLETEGDVSKYYIKADYAKTFSDNHQEFENAYFEIYDQSGGSPNKINAQKVLYIPEENKNFTAYLNGDVRIETREALKIKTNNVTYTKATETGEADELVEFERGNIRGKSIGAIVRMGDKRLDLLKDVEIETFESAELAKSNVRYSKINAASASYDQDTDKIMLNDRVSISIDSTSKGAPVSTSISAGRASLTLLAEKAPGNNDKTPSAKVKTLELYDNVNISSVENGGVPTTINAGYALFDKAADRYELTGGTHIVTTANGKTTDARALQALYDQAALKLALNGEAEVTQGVDYVKGNQIDADLFADKRVKYVVVRGDGLVRQTTDTRTTTLTGPVLNATFNESRQMQAANAIGQSTVQIVPNGSAAFSIATMNAPGAVHVFFKGEGLLDKVTTDGRTTLQLDVPNRDADAANKRVTADNVTTLFYDNGKDIRHAEAVGNAELYIEPLRAAPENYRTTVNAPRFDCDFFPTGNNVKTCIGGKNTKTVRVRTVAKEGRGTQTFVATQLKATFNENTKDVDLLEGVGSGKFVELDRTAIASQMSFTGADEMVRLRGGEPTAWDSKGRAKAREIDWDTRNQKSYLRGGVSTTYYSRKHASDSVPFGSSDKPVFITSDNAEFDHKSSVGVYTGKARAWQENNYIRAERLVVDEKQGRSLAEGGVQSAVYDVKQKQKGKDASVPVFATSQTMTYDRDTRLIQYRDSVDIRQGTDRITSASASIYLDDKNELSKSIAETNVVITQPGREATGDWAQYTAGDETSVLRGSPATLSDAENGTTEAAELTFYMRENRGVAESKQKPQSSGRIRSTYKIQPKK